jgi:ssDNA-binding Zn-finger/Zn-ribbon topoisomerase 1
MSDLTFMHIPECPLCYKQMREIFTRKGVFYACLDAECMVNIAARDPAVGKWRECESRMPPCPKHGTPMRAFFRALDGYKKVQCPKCRAEGKLTQVEQGKVRDRSPQEAQAWSVDPKELE